MKVIVKSNFTDRYTGELHKTGDLLEITDSRFAEIQGVGDFVEPAPVPPVEDVTPVDGEPEAPKTTTKKGRKKAEG